MATRRNPSIFISYSSVDRDAVSQLAEALKRNGVRVWLDISDIRVGESIPAAIQKGLEAADFIAVWLTKNAMASGWVTQEWHTMMVREINDRRTTVLPLLAEDCNLPPFLEQKKFADFRTNFAAGLNQLLAAVNPPAGPNQSHIIREHTRNFLRDLERESIPFPTLPKLKLLRALKELPRSGKLLRLHDIDPPILIRSIYDHILSVAHSADCLLGELQPKLTGGDLIEVARVIAYHDLCEVVLGDEPQFTDIENRRKRRLVRVDAYEKLKAFPPGVPEQRANDFIAMFLNTNCRESLEEIQRIIQNGTSEVFRYFRAMDKMDPIIATWRYLHVFRDDPLFPREEFFARMQHFFVNPKVASQVQACVDDKRLATLAKQLQDVSLAKAYLKNPDVLNEHDFALPASVLRVVIEDPRLVFAEKRQSPPGNKKR